MPWTVKEHYTESKEVDAGLLILISHSILASHFLQVLHKKNGNDIRTESMGFLRKKINFFVHMHCNCCWSMKYSTTFSRSWFINNFAIKCRLHQAL